MCIRDSYLWKVYTRPAKKILAAIPASVANNAPGSVKPVFRTFTDIK